MLNCFGTSTILNFLNSDRRFKLIKSLDSKLQSNLTIVMPVFNQESVIHKHLCALIDLAKNPLEIIIINDASTDDSHNEIILFMEKYQSNLRHKVKYYRTCLPLYETRCDDFGIRISSSKYIIEVQADMLMHEVFYDEKLLKLMERNLHLGMVSCRGVMKLNQVGSAKSVLQGGEIYDSIFLLIYRILGLKKIKIFINKIKISFGNYRELENKRIYDDVKSNLSLNLVFTDILSGSAGWLGSMINYLPYNFDQKMQDEISKFDGLIWLGETVMRGPIIFRKELYLQCGGFNTSAFYQGLDDHDLCIRVRNLGYQVGFTPIYFSSPMGLGVSRNNRKLLADLISKFNKILRSKNITYSDLYRHFQK